MEVKKAKIGNALTSSAANHVVAVSEDIYDESKGRYQSDINEDAVKAKIVADKAAADIGVDSTTLLQGGIDSDGKENVSSYYLRTSRFSTFKLEVNDGYTIGQLAQYDLVGNFINLYNDYTQSIEGVEWTPTSVVATDKNYYWTAIVFKGNSPTTAISPREAVVKTFASGLYYYMEGSESDPQSAAQQAKMVVDRTIEQLPNTQDLVLVDEKMQLANRAAAVKDGKIANLGYVILRPDKSFVEQVVDANTIYEIRYEFDLQGGTVTIKEGCTLKFVGGKLSNGYIVFNNCRIEAERDEHIFDNISFKSNIYGVAGIAFDGDNVYSTIANRIYDTVESRVAAINEPVKVWRALVIDEALPIKIYNESVTTNALGEAVSEETYKDKYGCAFIHTDAGKTWAQYVDLSKVDFDGTIRNSYNPSIRIHKGAVVDNTVTTVNESVTEVLLSEENIATLCLVAIQLTTFRNYYGDNKLLAPNNTTLYPEWFGAKYDGVTDDSDAFNKCFFLTNGRKSTVEASRGTTLINSTIVIPQLATFIGNGVTLNVNDNIGILFDVMNINNPYSGRISDVVINMTTPAFAGIEMRGGKNAIFDNFNITTKQAVSYGLKLSGYGYVTACSFSSIKGSGCDYGVHISRFDNHTSFLNANTLDINYLTSNINAIYTKGISGLTITCGAGEPAVPDGKTTFEFIKSEVELIGMFWNETSRFVNLKDNSRLSFVGNPYSFGNIKYDETSIVLYNNDINIKNQNQSKGKDYSKKTIDSVIYYDEDARQFYCPEKNQFLETTFNGNVLKKGILEVFNGAFEVNLPYTPQELIGKTLILGFTKENLEDTANSTLYINGIAFGVGPWKDMAHTIIQLRPNSLDKVNVAEINPNAATIAIIHFSQVEVEGVLKNAIKINDNRTVIEDDVIIDENYIGKIALVNESSGNNDISIVNLIKIYNEDVKGKSDLILENKTLFNTPTKSYQVKNNTLKPINPIVGYTVFDETAKSNVTWDGSKWVQKIQKKKYYNPTKIKYIPYRGLHDGSIPPESQYSVIFSALYGLKYSWCTVRYTSDGVGVILRDNDINRSMYNDDATELSDTVNISETTYENLLQYVFKSTNPLLRTKIQTVQEYIDTCALWDVSPFIQGEIKDEDLAYCVKKLGDNFIYHSTYSNVFSKIRNYSDNILILVSKAYNSTDETITALKSIGGNVGILRSTIEALPDELIAACKANGFEVMASTVYKKNIIPKVINKGVTMILSNNVGVDATNLIASNLTDWSSFETTGTIENGTLSLQGGDTFSYKMEKKGCYKIYIEYDGQGELWIQGYKDNLNWGTVIFTLDSIENIPFIYTTARLSENEKFTIKTENGLIIKRILVTYSGL